MSAELHRWTAGNTTPEQEQEEQLIEKMVERSLNPVLRGWIQYYRLAEVKEFADKLDQWIRRRLRLLIWMQWKRPYTRYKNLVKSGLSEDRARQSAFNGLGSWFNSGASHMNDAFRKGYFDNHGLVSVLDRLLTA